MINSFFTNREENIIYPGIILYQNVLSINESNIQDLISIEKHINEYYNSYYLNIKNTFFYGLDNINKKDFAQTIQKAILYYFAKYCDIYKEVIHTIQWQENIFIDIEEAGGPSFIFNPNKSFITENNSIKNTPFSRQVVVEIIMDDSYIGGSVEWPYLNNVKIDKISRGSILYYPANYLFSKKHNTIIKGRKIYLTTFFNGGKDFLAEENDLEEESTNFLFSYMR